jgi:predicted transport protein
LERSFQTRRNYATYRDYLVSFVMLFIRRQLMHQYLKVNIAEGDSKTVVLRDFVIIGVLAQSLKKIHINSVKYSVFGIHSYFWSVIGLRVEMSSN